MTGYEELDAQLRAWLDGDEALAKSAGRHPGGTVGGHWEVDCPCSGPCQDRYLSCQRVEGDIIIYPEGGHDAHQARHIARWDPATVLADIAGKRALLNHVAEWQHEYVDGDTWFSCSQAIGPHDADEIPGSGCADEDRAGEPCDCHLDDRRLAVLRCVAAGYIGRPEFKPEWRIDA